MDAPAWHGWRLADAAFFAALTLAGLLFYRTIAPVLVPVVLGAFAAVLARPSKVRLAGWLGGHTRLAAALTTLGVVLLVLLPAAFVGWMLAQEAVAAARWIAARVTDDGVEGIARRLPPRWRDFLPPEELRALANEMVTRAGALVTLLIARTAAAAAGGFLFVVSLYFFLVDGERWLGDLERMAPIDPRYLRAFAREFEATSQALFFGSVLTALVQGAVAAVGYALLGVPQALVWGAATAIMSFTPIVGTLAVWLPVGVVLVAAGAPARGLAVMAWGALVTGSIDNLVRPLLMKGRMRLHPLLVFLSIVGGVAAFGMVGILIGPLAAALFLAAVRIWDRDYRERLVPPAGGGGGAPGA